MEHDDSYGLELTGRITRGVGRGGYYMKKPGFERQFTSILGRKPFPGTVNVRVDSILQEHFQLIEEIKNTKGIIIQDFHEGNSHYFPGVAIRCSLILPDMKIPGIIFFPEKTVHPKDLLEFICPERVMDHAEIGDAVVIVI